MRSATAIAGYVVALSGPVIAIWLAHEETIAPALLTGALLGWTLIAALALRAAREPRERLLPNSSLATVLLAVGIAVILNGFVFGPWLIMIGGEIVFFGVIGLLGERLGARGRSG